MENYLFILIAIGIVGFIGYRIYKKKAKGRKPETPLTQMSKNLQDKLPGAWTDFKQSPGGVKVYSVVSIPANILLVLEWAARLRMEVIKRKFPHWTRFLTLPEYEIFLLHPDGIAPEAQIPFLTVGGSMSAGTVAEGERPVVMLPHYGTMNWQKQDSLFWSAYNEMEHLTELNDRQRFLQFTGLGDVHQHDEVPPELLATVPIDILPRGVVGFKSKIKSLPCGFSDIQVG